MLLALALLQAICNEFTTVISFCNFLLFQLSLHAVFELVESVPFIFLPIPSFTSVALLPDCMSDLQLNVLLRCRSLQLHSTPLYSLHLRNECPLIILALLPSINFAKISVGFSMPT